MTLLPSRIVWSRLVNCLPRAAVLIQRLSWQIWMASALRSTRSRLVWRIWGLPVDFGSPFGPEWLREDYR